MKKLLLITLAPLFAFAASPLDVKFSTDENANNGNILVSVTNHSKQDLEVLKWNTPFEKTLNADIFDVHMGATDNAYTGRAIKRRNPTDKDYMLFEAGTTERVSISIADYYEMKKKGKYSVRFDGTFKYRLLDSQKIEVNEMAKKVVPSINIFYVPSKTKQQRALSFKQTAKFNTCSQDEVKVLKVAHDDAIKMSKEAMDILKNAPKKTTSERYVTWFGKADEKRQKTVTQGFTKIYDAFENQNISFDCGTCKKDTDMYDSVYAYVYPNAQYTVYLCGAFWKSSTTGTDTQAGTLVHEVSHFSVVADTGDHAYGQVDAKKLAKDSPEKAIANAENYDYFAENNPNLSMESSDGSDGSGESEENNETDTDDNNNSDTNDNTDEYDATQEEAELDLCFELQTEDAIDACYTAWEDKYYPYDDDFEDMWNDDELNWDDIDWNTEEGEEDEK